MHDETDRFWQDLLTELDRGDTAPDLTMDEAEARMASAARIPFSKQEIDSIVSSATAEESAPGPRPLESPDPVPERRSFPTRYRTRSDPLYDQNKANSYHEMVDSISSPQMLILHELSLEKCLFLSKNAYLSVPSDLMNDASDSPFSSGNMREK